MKPGQRRGYKNNPYVHTNPIQRDKTMTGILGTYTRRGEMAGGEVEREYESPEKGEKKGLQTPIFYACPREKKWEWRPSSFYPPPPPTPASLRLKERDR